VVSVSLDEPAVAPGELPLLEDVEGACCENAMAEKSISSREAARIRSIIFSRTVYPGGFPLVSELEAGEAAF